MYGAMKEGANVGNIEAAIFPFTPFALYIIKIFMQMSRSIIDKDKLYTLLCNIKKKWLVFSVLTFIFIVVICMYSTINHQKIKQYYYTYQSRLFAQQEMSNWINENFSGKTIAISTHNYEIYNGTNINVSTDLSTEDFFDMAQLVTDKELDYISDNLKWDVIVTNETYRENRWPKTFDDYQALDPSEYPNNLPNIYVYIRKE